MSLVQVEVDECVLPEVPVKAIDCAAQRVDDLDDLVCVVEGVNPIATHQVTDRRAQFQDGAWIAETLTSTQPL